MKFYLNFEFGALGSSSKDDFAKKVSEFCRRNGADAKVSRIVKTQPMWATHHKRLYLVEFDCPTVTDMLKLYANVRGHEFDIEKFTVTDLCCLRSYLVPDKLQQQFLVKAEPQ